MRKLWLVILVGLIGAGGAALTAKHFRRAPPNLRSVLSATVPVVPGTVLQHDVPIYLRGVGTVIAHNNVVVRSQITGQLVKIAFTQGQTVKKGDLLAEIDPRPYQAQLNEAIANRDRDQAQVDNAQANLNRYLPLAKNGWQAPSWSTPQRPN